jgi:hypothetical protein
MQIVISEVISIRSDFDNRNKHVNEYLNRGYKVVQIVQTGPSKQIEDESKWKDQSYFPCYLVTYVLEK